MVFAIPTNTCYWLVCNIYDKVSYEKIYELKHRQKSVPFSIVLKDFDELARISNLTQVQIDFLRWYDYPFTILVKPNDNFVFPEFIDRTVYKELWIRVWEVCLHKDIMDLIELPFFMTSANLAWEKEIYSSDWIKEVFTDKDLIIVEWEIPTRHTSNIFRFVWPWLELDYIRKNY